MVVHVISEIKFLLKNNFVIVKGFNKRVLLGTHNPTVKAIVNDNTVEILEVITIVLNTRIK